MPSQERWLLPLLVIIILVPIWTFTYFPSQDGPIHLYNAHVIKNYSTGGNLFSQYYRINSYLLPNVLSDLILYALSAAVPLLLAEKILLSLYVILLIFALTYFTRAANPADGFALLGAVYAYNFFVLFGFYNFMLSIPLFFIALGFWLHNRSGMPSGHLLLLAIIIMLVYLGHLYAWALLVVCLVLLALILDWGRSLIKTLLAILPSAAAFILVVLGTGGPIMQHTLQFSRITTSLRMFLLPVFFRYFSEIEVVFSASLLLFLAAATCLPKPHRGAPYTATQKALLVLAGLLALAFFASPYSFGPAGYVNVRVLIFAFIMLTPLISIRLGSSLRNWAIGFVLAFCVVHSMHVIRIAAIYNAGYSEYASSIDKIKPNSIILAIVKDRHGPSKWVAPYSHFYYHYYLANNGINPYHQDGNIPAEELEAIERLSIVQLRSEYRSLRAVDFKWPLVKQQPKLEPYDYILVWDRAPQPEPLVDFSLIHRSPHLLIYERAKARRLLSRP